MPVLEPDAVDLAKHFEQLTDEELLRRFRSDVLTDAASAVALEEIRRRGLVVPVSVARVGANSGDGEYSGDYALVARFLNPTDAHIVRSCLEAAGVPAIVADDQLVQTNSLWAIALGGARILVPSRYVADAREAIAAFERGAFALPDEDDAQGPGVSARDVAGKPRNGKSDG